MMETMIEKLIAKSVIYSSLTPFEKRAAAKVVRLKYSNVTQELHLWHIRRCIDVDAEDWFLDTQGFFIDTRVPGTRGNNVFRIMQRKVDNLIKKTINDMNRRCLMDINKLVFASKGIKRAKLSTIQEE